jgi:hypothetical protein
VDTEEDVKGVVYIILTGGFPDSTDIAGTLYTAEKGPLWSHVSSSLSWLQRDLTVGFGDRRAQLDEMFPDGYDTVLVERDDQVPPEVARYFVVPA